MHYSGRPGKPGEQQRQTVHTGLLQEETGQRDPRTGEVSAGNPRAGMDQRGAEIRQRRPQGRPAWRPQRRPVGRQGEEPVEGPPPLPLLEVVCPQSEISES